MVTPERGAAAAVVLPATTGAPVVPVAGPLIVPDSGAAAILPWTGRAARVARPGTATRVARPGNPAVVPVAGAGPLALPRTASCPTVPVALPVVPRVSTAATLVPVVPTVVATPCPTVVPTAAVTTAGLRTITAVLTAHTVPGLAWWAGLRATTELPGTATPLIAAPAATGTVALAARTVAPVRTAAVASPIVPAAPAAAPRLIAPSLVTRPTLARPAAEVTSPALVPWRLMTTRLVPIGPAGRSPLATLAPVLTSAAGPIVATPTASRRSTAVVVPATVAGRALPDATMTPGPVLALLATVRPVATALATGRAVSSSRAPTGVAVALITVGVSARLTTLVV
ncbi:hypothetical protein [Actinocatenispora thailandica]|uniref:hypothetical protein n=1 Tax=Actinocatenispora thailandica TaxID=227318 RepID=UPI0031D4E893